MKKNLAAEEKRRRLRKADTVFVFDPRVSMNLSKTDLRNLDDLETYEELEWMVEVSLLATGANFGELALINNEPRAATIQCLSNCYFAVLSRENYAKTLRKQQVRELNQKMDFLSSLPFLKHQTQN